MNHCQTSSRQTSKGLSSRCVFTVQGNLWQFMVIHRDLHCQFDVDIFFRKANNFDTFLELYWIKSTTDEIFAKSFYFKNFPHITEGTKNLCNNVKECFQRFSISVRLKLEYFCHIKNTSQLFSNCPLPFLFSSFNYLENQSLFVRQAWGNVDGLFLPGIQPLKDKVSQNWGHCKT